MPSSAREEDRNAPVVRNAAPPLVASEAKMIVAIGHDHCQQLKDVLSKEDPSTMLVVMASSNQTSTPHKPRSPVMDLGLLAAVCSGSWQKLQSFLNKRGRQASSDGATGSSAMQPAFGDEEALFRETFLEGVTTEVDTFLHVMATNSDGENLNEHMAYVSYAGRQQASFSCKTTMEKRLCTVLHERGNLKGSLGTLLLLEESF